MLECKSAEVGEDNVVPNLLPLKRRPVMLNEVQDLHGLLHRRHAGCAGGCWGLEV
jgi:hypothetical protein